MIVCWIQDLSFIVVVECLDTGRASIEQKKYGFLNKSVDRFELMKI